tara:strand:+ start:198 stop:440 length:243 start_codon:yes stop_codon:yes gene_type:complete
MNILSIALIKLIKLYQLILSPYLGNNCRYLPTCSEYFIENLRVNGLIIGTIKGTKRIFSCHPIKFLGGGKGFDPVKKKSD